MATYKVPQDVEADDKLLGPFSFRQFIYLIVVAMAIGIAWGLSRLFIGLAIIPLPIIIFFGALALPLRKDQPMEIYLAALVSFYLKPRQRIWDPEGVETTIEITAPKVVEVQRTKDLSQTEAAQRLSYLADIVDSQGWAIRGVSGNGTAMNNDVYLEAQGAEDILDTNTSIAHSFDQMMMQSTERMREEAVARMTQATMPAAQPAAYAAPIGYAPQQANYPAQGYPAQPVYGTPGTQAYQQPTQAYAPAPTYAVAPAPIATGVPPIQQDPNIPAPHFDPYPTFHQSIIQPLNDTNHQAESDIQAVVTQQQPAVPVSEATSTTPTTTPEAGTSDSPVNTQVGSLGAMAVPAPGSPLAEYVAEVRENADEKDSSTSDTTPSADIINLANNPDLSIETIAREAERLKKKAKEESSDEVVISLR